MEEEQTAATVERGGRRATRSTPRCRTQISILFHTPPHRLRSPGCDLPTLMLAVDKPRSAAHLEQDGAAAGAQRL